MLSARRSRNISVHHRDIFREDFQSRHKREEHGALTDKQLPAGGVKPVGIFFVILGESFGTAEPPSSVLLSRNKSTKNSPLKKRRWLGFGFMFL